MISIYFGTIACLNWLQHHRAEERNRAQKIKRDILDVQFCNGATTNFRRVTQSSFTSGAPIMSILWKNFLKKLSTAIEFR